jgi:hypothetical protein
VAPVHITVRSEQTRRYDGPNGIPEDLYRGAGGQAKGERWQATVHKLFATVESWTRFISMLDVESLQGLQHLIASVVPRMLSQYGVYEKSRDKGVVLASVWCSVMYWAKWQVIEEGPGILWKAWWTSNNVGITDMLLADRLHEAS